MNWSKYKNFSKEEFDCKETGENKMRPEFLDVLQEIRTTFRKPMKITSGYRSPDHSIEAAKEQPGEHSYGLAADIAVQGVDAMDLFVIAYGYGIRRIGLQQRGNARFIHLGFGDKFANFPEALWTYKGK